MANRIDRWTPFGDTGGDRSAPLGTPPGVPIYWDM